MARFWEDGSGHASQCPSVRSLLRQLGAGISLEILVQLADRSADVTSLCRDMELEMNTVSRVLKQLHRYELVHVKRIKHRHVYSLGNGIHISLNGRIIYMTLSTADAGKVILEFPRE